MIYVTGDTHAEFHRFSQKTFSATAEDYVIICGDFGQQSAELFLSPLSRPVLPPVLLK